MLQLQDLYAAMIYLHVAHPSCLEAALRRCWPSGCPVRLDVLELSVKLRLKVPIPLMAFATVSGHAFIAQADIGAAMAAARMAIPATAAGRTCFGAPAPCDKVQDVLFAVCPTA